MIAGAGHPRGHSKSCGVWAGCPGRRRPYCKIDITQFFCCTPMTSSLLPDRVPTNGSQVGPEKRPETSTVAAVTFVLRHRRWFTAAFLFVTLLVIVIGYPKQVTYTSVASFVTEPQRGGTVSNLAAQLGVQVGSAPNSFTAPLFYPE